MGDPRFAWARARAQLKRDPHRIEPDHRSVLRTRAWSSVSLVKADTVCQ